MQFLVNQLETCLLGKFVLMKLDMLDKFRGFWLPLYHSGLYVFVKVDSQESLSRFCVRGFTIRKKNYAQSSDIAVKFDQ